jgi:UDP-N-acetylglucosamine--N-acetylmuramyl-(pentapeptide) pyrophosphoryl-undecaprenol N-acetylglucosamine transferase
MENKQKNTCAAFVAGRSGGHIIPAMVLAQNMLKKQDIDHILFFCSTKPLDLKIVDNYRSNSTIIPLDIDIIPYRKPWNFPKFLYRIGTSFLVSIYNLYYYQPSMLISLGSDISIPVIIAAFLLRIPIHLFEVNAVPGKSILATVWFASTIRICFPICASYFPSEKIFHQDYPIRFTSKDVLKKKIAQKQINLNPKRMSILILGGSQGSFFLNKCIKTMFLEHPNFSSHLQIMHQTGSDNYNEMQGWYKDHGIDAKVFSFTHSLAPYYCAADVVLCRAGAGTLFETLFFKKLFICIPLETSTTTHQLDNAQAIVQLYQNRCIVIQEQELLTSVSKLYTSITFLIDQANQ